MARPALFDPLMKVERQAAIVGGSSKMMSSTIDLSAAPQCTQIFLRESWEVS